VKDLVTGAITRASTAADGAQGNGHSSSFALSPDGTKLAFSSSSSNLVADDTHDVSGLFIKNLITGAIERVDITADGTQANGGASQLIFSPDGTKLGFLRSAPRFFGSDRHHVTDLFVKDLVTGEVTLVSATSDGTPANGYSDDLAFAPDGNSVAFSSDALNLSLATPYDDWFIFSDVYVKSLITGEVTRISSPPDFPESIDNDSFPVFSPDGTKLAFSGQKILTLGAYSDIIYGIYLKDFASGTFTLVSAAEDGTPGNRGGGSASAFSPDGRRIAFQSAATNLVPDDTNGNQDIFVKDLGTGKIMRVSMAFDGAEANGYSGTPFVFSPDGTKLAFRSDASNLVPGDANGHSDIFVVTLADTPLPPPDATIGLGRTEAETLDVGAGFVASAAASASGGAVLKAHGDGESRAAAVFDGAAGRYAVTVGYIDETDGAARMAIRINGVDVDAWTWDGAFGDAVVTRRGHAEHATFGVALKAGDVVELVGQRDGGEPLRTDWIDIAAMPEVGLGRTEAEMLATAGTTVGFAPHQAMHGSGGAYLQASGPGPSRAGMIFSGAEGAYDLTLGYFDEADGVSHMAIRVNGETVDDWAWDDADSVAFANPNSRAERVIAGLNLAAGDVIEFVGQRDGGEPLRTDWLEIETAAALRASAGGDETLVELAGFALEPSAAPEAFAQAVVGYLDDSHGDSRLDHQAGQVWGDWL